MSENCYILVVSTTTVPEGVATVSVPAERVDPVIVATGPPPIPPAMVTHELPATGIDTVVLMIAAIVAIVVGGAMRLAMPAPYSNRRARRALRCGRREQQAWLNRQASHHHTDRTGS